MVWRHVSSFVSSALGLQLYSPSSDASITIITITTAKFNSRAAPPYDLRRSDIEVIAFQLTVSPVRAVSKRETGNERQNQTGNDLAA
jgi:hypothetical protein